MLQLIYPHHMVIVWLEYVLLLFVVILFIDLIIALVLLVRFRSLLTNIDQSITNLKDSTNELHTTLAQISECTMLVLKSISDSVNTLKDSIVKPKETLQEVVNALSPEQKNIVKENLHELLPTSVETKVAVLDERASLDAGIPLYTEIYSPQEHQSAEHKAQTRKRGSKSKIEK